jgi:plastocyanin
MSASPSNRRRVRVGVAVVTAGAVAVTGALATGVASGARTVHINAKSQGLKFNRKTVRLRHGKVTFLMKNPSSLPHAIAVEGHGIDKDGRTVTKGGTSRVTVTLKKGRYAFYCPVDGHRAAGMRGTLVVR